VSYQRCESRLEFAMEARGFVFAFTCARGAGHDGRHHSQNVQRQKSSGTMKEYRIEWTEIPFSEETGRRRTHPAKNTRRFRYPNA